MSRNEDKFIKFRQGIFAAFKRYCPKEMYQDYYQDVFLRLLEAPYKEQGQAYSYAYKVAKNHCLDRLSKKKRRSGHVPEVASREFTGYDIEQEIRDRLKEMTPLTRDVFVEHYLKGKKMKDIAEERGEKVNTILARAKRGRDLFYRHYA